MSYIISENGAEEIETQINAYHTDKKDLTLSFPDIIEDASSYCYTQTLTENKEFGFFDLNIKIKFSMSLGIAAGAKSQYMTTIRLSKNNPDLAQMTSLLDIGPVRFFIIIADAGRSFFNKETLIQVTKRDYVQAYKNKYQKFAQVVDPFAAIESSEDNLYFKKELRSDYMAQAAKDRAAIAQLQDQLKDIDFYTNKDLDKLTEMLSQIAGRQMTRIEVCTLVRQLSDEGLAEMLFVIDTKN
jgi:DNA-directed RNA polymerase beta subunit